MRREELIRHWHLEAARLKAEHERRIRHIRRTHALMVLVAIMALPVAMALGVLLVWIVNG